jgi:hypothetical protein
MPVLILDKDIAGKPTEVGFISNENQLTVELIHASEFLIVLGNFTRWAWAYDNELWVDKNKDFFASLIRDLYCRNLDQARVLVFANDLIFDEDFKNAFSIGTDRERKSGEGKGILCQSQIFESKSRDLSETQMALHSTASTTRISVILV